jgi:hypothetical protein
MIVQNRFQQVITFLKRGVKRLYNKEIPLKHPKQTKHIVEQLLLAYSISEKSLLQQSSA